MSTGVDNKRRRPRLSAEQSRARILAAARIALTRAGYDTVGVREIAEMAGVDPAMVPRLFGSKEAVFTEIADGAFSLEPSFEGPIKGLENGSPAIFSALFAKRTRARSTSLNFSCARSAVPLQRQSFRRRCMLGSLDRCRSE